jgi:hypothetical protein
VTFVGVGIAYGQGQIDFRTWIPGLIDAPVFDTNCQTRIVGPEMVGQVYLGVTPQVLSPIGHVLPFGTGAAAGYWNGPAGGVTIRVPGQAGPSPVYVQLRAWDAAAGSTYDAAVSAGGRYGFSNIAPADPSLPPAPPGHPLGLEGFCLVNGSVTAVEAIRRNGTNLVITFNPGSSTNSLQAAASLSGPWEAVTNAIPPYYVIPQPWTKMHFFRAVLTNAPVISLGR